MLLPFILLGCAWIVLRLYATPGYKSFAQKRLEYMKARFRDIKHKINFCPTTTALEESEDEIVIFFEQYKFEPGARGYTSELYADLQNRRTELIGYKRSLRA
jgi:hypothetical protein